MRTVSMIPSLYSLLLFYFLTCSATASLDVNSHEIYDDVTERRVTTQRRATNSSSENWSLRKFPGDFSNSIGQVTALGSEYIGCAVNGTSPTEQDVRNATQIVVNKGDQSCVSGDSSSPRCALLATGGSANIFFCGYPGVRISCSDLVDTIMALASMCVKVVGGESRVRGTVALFPGGNMKDNSKLSFITVVSSDEDQLSEYL